MIVRLVRRLAAAVMVIPNTTESKSHRAYRQRAARSGCDYPSTNYRPDKSVPQNTEYGGVYAVFTNSLREKQPEKPRRI